MLHRDVLVVRASTLNKPYKKTNQRTWTGTQKDMLTNHFTYVDRKMGSPHTHTHKHSPVVAILVPRQDPAPQQHSPANMVYQT